MFRFLDIPRNGASNAGPFENQPRGTVPLESLRNFDVHTGPDDRARGGKRPPVKLIFQRQLNNAPVQGLISMSRAGFVSGYTKGSCDPVSSIVSRSAGSLTGNVFVIDDTPALVAAFNVDITPYGGVQSQASVNAIDANDSIIVAACNFPASPYAKALLQCMDWDGNVLWTVELSSASTDRWVNTVAISPNGNNVAVCFNEFIQLRSTADGSISAAATNVTGWANECTDARWRSDGKLLVCFNGTSLAGFATYNGTPIESTHFRSGVALFEVVVGGMTRRNIGAELSATDPWQEVDGGGAPVRHGYVRFSEFSVGKPRGCYPTSIAVASDSSFFVGRTNQGWGPQWIPGPTTIFPDGTTPYVSLAKYNSSGVLVWEADPPSARLPYAPAGFGATWYNDIDSPTIQAVAVDSSGDLYAAGQRNGLGMNVWKIRGSDGALLWDNQVGVFVRQAAIRLDSSGNLWVAGDRSDAWTGSGGSMAHLWKLRPLDGEIMAGWDIGENVSALSVAHHSDGRIVYGTDYVA